MEITASGDGGEDDRCTLLLSSPRLAISISPLHTSEIFLYPSSADWAPEPAASNPSQIFASLDVFRGLTVVAVIRSHCRLDSITTITLALDLAAFTFTGSVSITAPTPFLVLNSLNLAVDATLVILRIPGHKIRFSTRSTSFSCSDSPTQYRSVTLCWILIYLGDEGMSSKLGDGVDVVGDLVLETGEVMLSKLGDGDSRGDAVGDVKTVGARLWYL